MRRFFPKNGLQLLKADIDRYADEVKLCGLERKWDFSHSRWAYVKNFMFLFFFKNFCFRTIFYYRFPVFRVLLSPVFRKEYKTLTIGCPDVAGGGMVFEHAYSTILNCDHIGYGCKFLHCVTVGNKTKDGKIVRPYLGDNVLVGAGAIIIGDVQIGNNVKIGAGAVVTKSIPDNCVVVGNPAHIIYRDGKRV